MLTFLARRISQAIVVLLLISFIGFLIFQFLGDPAVAMAGRYASQEQRAQVREALGLNEPIYEQYFVFLKNALHGDFGQSYVYHADALQLILDRLPASIELAVTAMVIALFFGIVLGVIASLNPKAMVSRFIMSGSLLGVSIPTFVTGILFILLFAVQWNVFPTSGRGEVVRLFPGWETNFLSWDGIKHLILPAVTLSFFQLAVLLRLTRGGMVEILQEDYVRTAWAKGLMTRVVVFKHALRNVLIPVITMVGLQLGELIAHSIVTESIFQWPGAGQLLLTALYEADRPVLVTYIVMAAFFILLINLVVDIMYGLLNPKIRYG